MRVFVGVWKVGGGRLRGDGNVGSGNLEEEELAGFGRRAGGGAEIAGGDAGVEDVGDGVVGVELSAGAAVGVHVREDAEDGGVADVDDDDAVFVGGHGDGTDLLDAEGYVEFFVGDGFVGFGVEDADGDMRGLVRWRGFGCLRGEGGGEDKEERGGSEAEAGFVSQEG